MLGFIPECWSFITSRFMSHTRMLGPLTPKAQVQTPKVQRYKFRHQKYRFLHPKYKFRHPKHSGICSDTQSIVQNTSNYIFLRRTYGPYGSNMTSTGGSRAENMKIQKYKNPGNLKNVPSTLSNCPKFKLFDMKLCFLFVI